MCTLQACPVTASPSASASPLHKRTHLSSKPLNYLSVEQDGTQPLSSSWSAWLWPWVLLPAANTAKYLCLSLIFPSIISNSPNPERQQDTNINLSRNGDQGLNMKVSLLHCPKNKWFCSSGCVLEKSREVLRHVIVIQFITHLPSEKSVVCMCVRGSVHNAKALSVKLY